MTCSFVRVPVVTVTYVEVQKEEGRIELLFSEKRRREEIMWRREGDCCLSLLQCVLKDNSLLIWLDKCAVADTL